MLLHAGIMPIYFDTKAIYAQVKELKSFVFVASSYFFSRSHNYSIPYRMAFFVRALDAKDAKNYTVPY